MKRLVLLLAVVASLFVMAAPAAATASTYTWQGNGYPNQSCDEGSSTMLWIWTGDNPTDLTINGDGQSGSWHQQGNGSWHFTVDIGGGNFPPTSASIHYTGDAGTLTLSGCDEGATPTPTPTLPPPPPPTPSPTPTPTPTPTLPVDTASPPPTPTPTPTEFVTPPPETPTPSIETFTPPPSIGQFSVQVEPCPIGSFSVEPTKLRIIGLLLIGFKVKIDGDVVVPDTHGDVVVQPGLRHVEIDNADGVAVFAADVECPTCTADVTPPDNITSPPKKTLPPTDAIASTTSSGGGSSLPMILLTLGALAATSLLLARSKR